MHTVKNPKRELRVINLPTRTLYLAAREIVDLTDEEYTCRDVRALFRVGLLRDVGGDR